MGIGDRETSLILSQWLDINLNDLTLNCTKEIFHCNKLHRLL